MLHLAIGVEMSASLDLTDGLRRSRAEEEEEKGAGHAKKLAS